MALPRPSTPRAAFADLRTFLRNRGRHQLLAGALAIILPAIILLGFYTDSNTNTMPKPTVIYTESWSAKRTDAEIKAQQIKDSEARKAAKLEKQRQFQRLEKQLGM